MSIKKQYLKSRPECKVTFKLGKLNNVDSVNIVGSFNNWSPTETSMEKLKNGSFSQTCYLEAGVDIQFRYLIDNMTWMTEEEADDFVETGMGDNQLNAVIKL
nr:isoamylase early set domain-containing protein [uncultured Carboxylicivirga sp.]